MEKTRVPKGERYYTIVQERSEFTIRVYFDEYDDWNDADYENGNYFYTKEEAEACACRLRAVLNGAEVIETPTPDEVYKECKKRNPHIDEESIVGGEWQEGFFACANFMKSKIVK